MASAVRAALARLPVQTLRSEADALALAVHAMMEEDGLRCIACSESVAKASAAAAAPASSGPLPADWNAGEDVYCLYYKHAACPAALFTVKSIVMDDTLLVHAASDQSADVHCVEIRAGDFVQFVPSKASGAALDCEKIYSDLDALQRAVRVNATHKLLPSQAGDGGSQVGGASAAQAQSCHQAAVEATRPGGPNTLGPWPGHLHPGLAAAPDRAGLAQMYTDMGRADLMPGGLGHLGGGPGGLGVGGMGGDFGGGNMFGPRHPAFAGGGVSGVGGGFGGGASGLAAPPGARFDPFGPPGAGGFGGMGNPMGGMARQRPREIPDNDIFRPPFGGDDMFM
jgi:proteasome inhibitor subunit 1 (PI31)